jgi:hypothetical protein
MLYHLQKFSICEIGHERSGEAKEVLDKLGAHEPRAKGIIGIVLCVGKNEEHETITETIEYLEACWRYKQLNS